jgi:hypothetical protein
MSATILPPSAHSRGKDAGSPPLDEATVDSPKRVRGGGGSAGKTRGAGLQWPL